MKWRPRYDGKSPIRSYNIEYNEEFGGWKRYKFGIPPVEDVGADLNQLEIKKLLPGTKYQFRIRANNDLGSSTWSDKSRLITTNSEGKLIHNYIECSNSSFLFLATFTLLLVEEMSNLQTQNINNFQWALI